MWWYGMLDVTLWDIGYGCWCGGGGGGPSWATDEAVESAGRGRGRGGLGNSADDSRLFTACSGSDSELVSWVSDDFFNGDELSSNLPTLTFSWTFMCLRSELGCVYVLSQPSTRHVYGLSVVCTNMCFLRSDELAKRRSQPGNSHLNGFSPVENKYRH